MSVRAFGLGVGVVSGRPARGRGSLGPLNAAVGFPQKPVISRVFHRRNSYHFSSQTIGEIVIILIGETVITYI